MGYSQLQIKDATKRKLDDLKKATRSKSSDAIINRLLTVHYDRYKNPKEIALEELKNSIDKYHYLFSKDEFLILTNIYPLLMASSNGRINMLKKLSEELEKNIKGQNQLKE